MTEQIKDLIYPVEVFLKYRNQNKIPDPKFEKYLYRQNQHGKKKNFSDIPDILDKPEIKTKLNSIINKNSMSNIDIELYNKIRCGLNKVSNKVLSGDPKTNGLDNIVNSLTSLPYDKLEHFKKLAEIILDKSLNEPQFMSVYSLLCVELSAYHIEIDGKQILFKVIMLELCQMTFENLLRKCATVDKDRLVNFIKLIGNLFNRKFMAGFIVLRCFDGLIEVVFESPNISVALLALVELSYKNVNDKIRDHIKSELHKVVDSGKLHVRSKFAIQDAIQITVSL